MFKESFKESQRVHVCPSVATLQQREKWYHQPQGAGVIDTDNRDLDDEDSMMPLLIYPEDSNNEEDNPCESLSIPTSTEPTP